MHATETSTDQSQPVPPAGGHEMVIRFVLSGPIFAEHVASAQVAHPAQSDDVTALRDRVDALERAVSDAQARLEALSLTLATAVPSTADVAEPGPAHRVALTAVPSHDTAWVHDGVFSVPPPAASTQDAGRAEDLGLAEGTGFAAAAPLSLGDRNPLAEGAPSELEPPHAAAPKVRGLRRMISVLRHN